MANLPVKLVAHYHSLELYFVLQVSGEYWLRAQILKSDYLDLNPISARYLSLGKLLSLCLSLSTK